MNLELLENKFLGSPFWHSLQYKLQSIGSKKFRREISFNQLNIESLLSMWGIDYRLEGTKTKMIKRVSTIEEATEDALTFCSSEGEKGISLISKSNAGIILCRKSMEEIIHPRIGTQIFFLDNPRLVFIQIINQIYNKKKKRVGVSKRATIPKTAKIGSNCYIGNNTVIGDKCKIGDNTFIDDNVVLQNCVIGNNCIIQPGVKIGADGFAYERYQTLELERFPHLMGVMIGNNVEIGANCSIARGSLSDTVICDGTKLDALVHVAHNVVIGKCCELTAGTIIGGSTTIGEATWLGLNSTLKHKIKVGNKVIVGCGATVIHDIVDEDIVAGVPAKSIKYKVNSKQLFLMAGQ